MCVCVCVCCCVLYCAVLCCILLISDDVLRCLVYSSVALCMPALAHLLACLLGPAAGLLACLLVSLRAGACSHIRPLACLHVCLQALHGCQFLLAGCLRVGRMVGWCIGWLVGWLAGWLAGWLVGWLAGCVVSEFGVCDCLCVCVFVCESLPLSLSLSLSLFHYLCVLCFCVAYLYLCCARVSLKGFVSYNAGSTEMIRLGSLGTELCYRRHFEGLTSLSVSLFFCSQKSV